MLHCFYRCDFGSLISCFQRNCPLSASTRFEAVTLSNRYIVQNLFIILYEILNDSLIVSCLVC